MWMVYAFGAAIFAGLTAILAKAGVKTTPSTLATALRTVIVLLGSILMEGITGSAHTLGDIDPKTWIFLILSGLATGASWLCFFKALQLGPVSTVSAIDKSSIVLTILLAIFLLGETSNLALRLVGITLIGIGTYLMLDKNPLSEFSGMGPWVAYAFGAAVFAALTAILGKVGITGVESNLGTTIRTVVVLVMAWLIVAVNKEHTALRSIPRNELTFIGLSGLATGASWLCYWRAMHDGPASVVASIDKLSILVTVVLAWLIYGERQSPRALLGLGLIAGGTGVMIIL